MYVVLLFEKRIAERAANIRTGCISFGMFPQMSGSTVRFGGVIRRGAGLSWFPEWMPNRGTLADKRTLS